MERAKLSSADHNTRELHDQFYRDHKLLLVLFRVLAVMPITRSLPGKDYSTEKLTDFQQTLTGAFQEP